MLKFRTTLVAACLVILAAGGANSAQAEARHALVIANGSYSGGLAFLPNPVNDGKAVAAALEQVGFSVTLVADANQAEMKKAIKDFGETLEIAGKDTVGLFYYAGHGMQIDGVNYLMPVGAEIDRESDADIEAVQAETVLRQMEFANTRVNIVILDACRNNPLSRGTGNTGKGLARMDAPTGSFVAYSTAPGNLAIDGAGANSAFAEALSTEILVPNLSIEEVFRRVRVKVQSETDDQQVPWDSSSLTSSFTFNASGGAADQVVAAADPRLTQAESGINQPSVNRGGEKHVSNPVGTGLSDVRPPIALHRELRPRADMLDALNATPVLRGFPKPQNYRASLRYQFIESNHSLVETVEVKAISGNLAATRRESVETKPWNGVAEAYRLDNTEDEVVIGPVAVTQMSSGTVKTPRGTEKQISTGRISALHEAEGRLFPMRSGAWVDITYAYEEPGGKPRDVQLFAEVTEGVSCEDIHATLRGRCFKMELTTRLVDGPETSYRQLLYVEDLAAFIPLGEFGSNSVPAGRVELVSIEPIP